MGVRIYFIIFFMIISSITSSAKIISFEEQYLDYLGQPHKYNSYNILLFPMYQVTDNGNNWTISRQGTTVNLSKQFTRNGITFNVNYQFLTDRIIPSIQIDSYSQISNFVVKVNGTVWYLPFPWSASQVKSVTDDLIDMGVFKRTTSISVIDSNATPNSYKVLPKVINGDIRLYFNPTTFSGVVYPLILTENTITVSNATTSGFTSSNITFDGVRWTDSGQIAINLRNDSQANMTGLVGYWSMDENTGTPVHNVNTESGLVNTTNQGTWNGNTTLNYTTGQIGNALAFDGVDDYVNVGQYTFNGDFSVSTWINRHSQGNQMSVVGRNNNFLLNTYDYWIGYRAYFRITSGSTLYDGYFNTDAFYLNSWYYLVITYDSTTGIFNNYVNGVPDGMTDSAGGIVDASVANLLIGAWDATSYNFNGSIDEVRIYNRALSAAEIAVMYNTSLRTRGNLTILNQSASAGNVINRTRIVYNGQESINNASIYARQNGTTTWSLVQNNATSNTWYSITDQYQSNDFKVQLDGNGSNTPFFTSLEWDEGEPSGTGYYNLSGYVTNTFDLPIENARVHLNNTVYNVTNATGYYSFSNIANISYSITSQMIGYRNSTNTTVLNSDTTMNFTMKERKTAIQTPGFNSVLLFISLISIYLYMKRVD